MIIISCFHHYGCRAVAQVENQTMSQSINQNRTMSQSIKQTNRIGQRLGLVAGAADRDGVAGVADRDGRCRRNE